MTPSVQATCQRHRRLTGRYLASCQACCSAAKARRVAPEPVTPVAGIDRTFALAA